jgi:RNA polymerase sigma-70 factor, ECF subfamily
MPVDVTQQDPWSHAAIEQNRHWLLAFLLSACGDYASAEDMVQEVFRIAYEKRFDFVPNTEFGGWLRGVARNCLKRHFEKKKQRPIMLDDALDHLETAAAQAEGRLLDSTWLDERVEAMRNCMRSLGERAREIMDLRYAQELSAQEVAGRMSMTVSAVNVAAFRARDVLADCVNRKLNR